MRLPVIQTCARCRWCDEFVDAWHRTEHSCSHGQRGDFVGVVAPDHPPPSWCPLRTGPDAAELEALRAVAEAARYAAGDLTEHVADEDCAGPRGTGRQGACRECRVAEHITAALRRLDEVRRG